MAEKRPPCHAPPDAQPAPRGRPRAKEPGTALTTWVPKSEYDRLCRMANEQEQSLSRLVRQWLAKKR
jgi:hypothetical protein